MKMKLMEKVKSDGKNDVNENNLLEKMNIQDIKSLPPQLICSLM